MFGITPSGVIELSSQDIQEIEQYAVEIDLVSSVLQDNPTAYANSLELAARALFNACWDVEEPESTLSDLLSRGCWSR